MSTPSAAAPNPARPASERTTQRSIASVAGPESYVSIDALPAEASASASTATRSTGGCRCAAAYGCRRSMPPSPSRVRTSASAADSPTPAAGTRGSPSASSVRRSTPAGDPAGSGPRRGSDTVEARGQRSVLGELSAVRRAACGMRFSRDLGNPN